MRSGANKINLIHAAKPHGCGVTALAVSPDGQRLASAASDGSVFFLRFTVVGAARLALVPLGFVHTPFAKLAAESIGNQYPQDVIAHSTAPKILCWTAGILRCRMPTISVYQQLMIARDDDIRLV